jgi:hypothetical protein
MTMAIPSFHAFRRGVHLIVRFDEFGHIYEKFCFEKRILVPLLPEGWRVSTSRRILQTAPSAPTSPMRSPEFAVFGAVRSDDFGGRNVCQHSTSLNW